MAIRPDKLRAKIESLISAPFHNELGSDLKMYDKDFNEVPADEADHFVVTRPDNDFTISIDDTDNFITMTLGKDIRINPNDFDSESKVDDVHKHLKRFIRGIPEMKFDVKTLGRAIVRRDIKSLTSTDKEQNVTNVFNESVGRLEGTIRTSKQLFDDATLIVKHRNPVKEEKRGARARDIKAMYIANASGERFHYPYKHLGGARSLARHIGAGGSCDDMVGESIIGLSENLYKLREFLNITKRQGLVNEANEKIIEGCKKKMESIKETVKSLQTNKGYTAFVESLSINGSNTTRELSEEVFNEYVDRFTVHKFDESLRGIIPLIHTIKEESEAEDMKFTMERFVETYKRHAEPVISDPENFTVYFTPEGTGGKEVDFGAAISNVQSSNYAKHKIAPNAREAFQMGAKLVSMANSIRVIEHQGKTKKALAGNGKAADVISNMLSDGAKLLEGNPAHLKVISKLPVIRNLISIYENKENMPSTVESIGEKLDTMVENAFKKYDPEYVLLENWSEQIEDFKVGDIVKDRDSGNIYGKIVNIKNQAMVVDWGQGQRSSLNFDEAMKSPYQEGDSIAYNGEGMNIEWDGGSFWAINNDGAEVEFEPGSEDRHDPMNEEVSDAPYDSIGELDDFVEGYIDAAAWTEDEELGDAQWSKKGLADMKEDATDFYQKAEDLLSQVDNEHGMAGHGHDFWLTRNKHGAGFWDRGYGEVGKQLSELAKQSGEAYIYAGDDGMIYVS